MSRLRRFSCAAVIFAITLTTQHPMAAKPAQSKRALVKKLIEITKVPENMQKSLAMVKQMQQNMIIRMTDDVKNRDLIRRIQQRCLNLVMAKFSWTNFQDDFINVYAEVFSEDELRGLIKFYRTPLGRKLVDKMPLVQKKLMPIVQQKIIKLLPEVRAAVARIIAEEKAKEAKLKQSESPTPAAAIKQIDGSAESSPKK